MTTGGSEKLAAGPPRPGRRSGRFVDAAACRLPRWRETITSSRLSSKGDVTPSREQTQTEERARDRERRGRRARDVAAAAAGLGVNLLFVGLLEALVRNERRRRADGRDVGRRRHGGGVVLRDLLLFVLVLVVLRFGGEDHAPAID